MLKRQRPPNVSEALARGRYFGISEMSLVDHAELPSSRPEHQTNAYTQRSVPTLARPQRVTAGMWACRPDRAMPSRGLSPRRWPSKPAQSTGRLALGCTHEKTPPKRG